MMKVSLSAAILGRMRSAMNILQKLLPRRLRGLLRGLALRPGATFTPPHTQRDRWYEADAWQKHGPQRGAANFSNLSAPHRANVLDWIMRIAPEHDSVLEVSCHHGYYIEELRSRGYTASYVGIDITQNFLEVARKRLPGEDFRWGDARSLDFPQDSFDLVMATGILMHLPRPAKAARDIFRIARKYVLISVYGSDRDTPGPVRYRRSPNPVAHFLDFFFSKEEVLSWVPRGWEVVAFKKFARTAEPPRHPYCQLLAKRSGQAAKGFPNGQPR